MKCRRCGAEIDDSLFCELCGARQAGGAVSRRKMNVMAAVIAVVLLAAGILVGLLLPAMGSHEAGEQPPTDTVATDSMPNPDDTTANVDIAGAKSDDANDKTATTIPETPSTPEKSSNTGTTDEYWVDLGLPSGLLWAKCNLGASRPEQYGKYYAWGETKPKSDYRWSTYRYATVDADGELKTLTKYNTDAEYGTVDGKKRLANADDAAAAVLGGGARMPTHREWEELIDNTTSECTTSNGVRGRKFTSKKNGNSLFLPAAGGRLGSSLYYDGTYGRYWSSSLDESYPFLAWSMYFYSDGQGVDDYYFRYYGQFRSARCVLRISLVPLPRTRNWHVQHKSVAAWALAAASYPAHVGTLLRCSP